MLKYASAQIMTADLAPKGASRRELRRFAHRHHFDYEVRPGYLYVRSRAISSRCNDNFDEFPAEELEQAYASFKGKPVFVNHVNHDHHRARGVIIDAALHKDANRDGSKDYWVEVLMEVDAVRFPRLAKEILAGNIARTSMGCDVAFSVCSACGNKATTPAEYCQHIPGSKGMMLYRRTASGQKVGEIIRETCFGLKFFENSLLVEPPADPTAAVLGTPFLAPGTKLSSLNVSPRTPFNDPSNDGVGDSVLLAEGSVGDGSAAPTALPLGEKVGHRADLSHGLVSEFGGGVGDALQTPEPLRHVPGVLGVGPQDPVVGVVAQGGVTGVANNQAVRDRAHQGRVAPSVGPDTASRFVVQGQATVPVLEGASGPRPTIRRVVGEGDLGQVARKNARKGPHEAHSILSEDEKSAMVKEAFRRSAARKTAFGEQKAPADVDTLREDACPVCGDRDTFDGDTCQVCSYVAPPKIFQDPDLEKARQMDLRKDIAEFNDPANPNPQLGPDGQPVEDPMDPGALDADGNPMDPTAEDPSMQPGGLPGEVQAEVQPADGDPMDPEALGEEGQIPDETGAPVDPSMIGPDGQPLQGQQMTLPDGTPIGPQELPADATTNMGQPFTPGPNMPEGPGEPEGPEGPATPEDLDEDGQLPDADAGQGVPGTPGDGVPDLMCPACGFTSEAAAPTSIDMDTQQLPNAGVAEMDGVQAGDVCPNCGSAQLLSPAEVQGETSVPMPV